MSGFPLFIQIVNQCMNREFHEQLLPPWIEKLIAALAETGYKIVPFNNDQLRFSVFRRQFHARTKEIQLSQFKIACN